MRIGACLFILSLVIELFGAMPAQAGSLTQLSITANPTVAMVGIPVSFTLNDRWLINGDKPTILTANVTFGDGSMQVVTMVATVASEFTGSTVHAFTRPGTYTISATDQRGSTAETTVTITTPATPAPMPSATPQPTASPTPQPTRTPQPTSPPTPIATQTPNATPSATIGQITNLTLAWPNGSAQLGVAAGQSIPAPSAGVALSVIGPVTLQWTIDGSPTNVSSVAESSPNAMQHVSYPGALPTSSGQHTVSVHILSPSNATQIASITYLIAPSSSTPPAAGTPQVLHFDGFHLFVKTITQEGSSYSGTGTVTVADSAPHMMNFTGVTFNAPSTQTLNGIAYSVADVTAGSADPQPVRGHSVTICPGEAPSSIHIGPNAPGPGGRAHVLGALGNFTDQGYLFALETLHLAAIGSHSTATMCYPTSFPTNETSSTNAGCTANVQNQYHRSTTPSIGELEALSYCVISTQLARVLSLPTTTIDESGHFDDDLPGNAVGPLCIGLNGCPSPSTFNDEPTATDTLQFRFGASDASPNIHFPGVAVAYDPFVSAIVGYSGPWSNAVATTPIQDWLPNGNVNATITFADGTQLLTPTNGLILTCHQCSSTIANDALTGGTYAGQFATAATLSNSGTGHFHPGGVLAFNTQQVAMNRGRFGNNGSTSSNLSGSFSGTQNADGSMFAPIAGMNATTIGGAVVTPSGGYLALNGQVSGLSWGVEYLTTQLRTQDPFWNSLNSGAQGPQVSFDSSIQQHGGGSYGTGEPSDVLDSGLYITAGTYADGETFGAGRHYIHSIGGQASAYGFLFYGNDGYFGQIALNSLLSGGASISVSGFSYAVSRESVLIAQNVPVAAHVAGSLAIPAPVNATVSAVANTIDANGNPLSVCVCNNPTIPLQGWDASVQLAAATAPTNGSLPISGTFTNAGTGSYPITGAIRSDGTIDNDALTVSNTPTRTFSGLDINVTTIVLPHSQAAAAQLANAPPPHRHRHFGSGMFDDLADTSIPLGVGGNEAMPGWAPPSNGSNNVTLLQNGGTFAPPHGFSFNLTQRVAGMPFQFTVSYNNNVWQGFGNFATADNLINVNAALRFDATTERIDIGTSIGQSQDQGADGQSPPDTSKNQGSLGLTTIGGLAVFSRQTGALNELAFGANLNLSVVSGSALVVYHSNLSDLASNPNFSSNQALGILTNGYGWNTQCSQGWCIGASAVVGLSAAGNVNGAAGLAFDSNGFAFFLQGNLQGNPLFPTNPGMSLSGEFYHNPTAWDISASVTGIPILGISVLGANGQLCIWDHKNGHVDACPNTGYTENGYGMYISAGATLNIYVGNVNAAVNFEVTGPHFGIGGGAHLSGTVGIDNVGVTVAADLTFNTTPFYIQGDVRAGVCVFNISTPVGNAQLGAYFSLGLKIDTGGVHPHDVNIGYGCP